MMDFDAFSARAREIVEGIPDEFLDGIETVDVHRDAKPDPHLADIYRLGECETSPLSDPTGSEPFTSIVHLYYGSFVAIAENDPGFDVDAELEETIRHEVQHHLEDRAGWKDLRDEDALFEAHALFRAGEAVPVGWYRHGERLEASLWAVDLDLFLELELRRGAWEALPGSRLTLTIFDETFEIDVPEDASPDEVWSFAGEGLLEGEEDEEEVVVNDTDDDEAPAGVCGDLHVIPVVR